MITYKYILQAATKLYSGYDNLSGVVNSPHGLTRRELRTKAISVVDSSYTTFGTLTVESSVLDTSGKWEGSSGGS